ncbi:DUF5304 family protein [Streptomyces sp. CNQ085]|uniref:DUF5304 family protein n=1 Tax=Streptomyces sp. CNQ085 TaxID=2886944 RepID=UPI001F50768F|nr:DUF5304 family protein [Streptomyces sp. CNQ085]MCI0386017.1 DUF5304 domain-containing protein [Streptomyces sp. CNQ085]
MSDATERPSHAAPGADSDAWASACEEDLAAERERRRERYGTPPGSAAEELLKLAEAVTGKLAEIGGPLAGPAARGAARQFAHFADRARAAVEPVVERNPEVFDHLAAAGGELLAAYRAAVADQEGRWTRGGAGGSAPEDGGGRAGREEDRGAAGNGKSGKDGRVGEGEGPAGSQRIELD